MSIPFSFISFIVVISFLSLFIKFLETYVAPTPLNTKPRIEVNTKIGKELVINSSNISSSLIICIVYLESPISSGPVIKLYISKSKIFIFISVSLPALSRLIPLHISDGDS